MYQSVILWVILIRLYCAVKSSRVSNISLKGSYKFRTYEYIRLTNAYAAKNPMVPVNRPYTAQAKKLYVKKSIPETKPVM
jgi:hypothetical protein